MLNGLWGTEIREEVGINIKNESSLHNQIKSWYGKEDDRFQVRGRLYY